MINSFYDIYTIDELDLMLDVLVQRYVDGDIAAGNYKIEFEDISNAIQSKRHRGEKISSDAAYDRAMGVV